MDDKHTGRLSPTALGAAISAKDTGLTRHVSHYPTSYHTSPHALPTRRQMDSFSTHQGFQRTRIMLATSHSQHKHRVTIMIHSRCVTNG